MSYVEGRFESFGAGLNIRDAPDVLGEAQALDCLNAVFTERGTVKSRDGYGILSDAPMTNAAESLEPFYATSGTKQLLAGCGTRLEAVSTAGAIVASATGLTNAVWDFARFGAPNAEVAYAGNGTDTLRKWNGSAWSAPTATVGGVGGLAMPKAGKLCVTPWDNRLVATGFATTTGAPNGATSSPSHVYFSHEGLPEVYTANNFIQLVPGDGERVMGCVAWREYVFIFKETKFFVVYGTETNVDGSPTFNYRPVDVGVGLASARALTVSEEGVYFMGREGVYRTTGGPPEKVSSALDPIFLGEPHRYFKSSPLNQGSITKCAMGRFGRWVLLAYPSGTATENDRLLVLDPAQGWWTIWDLPAACIAEFRVSNDEDLVFGLTASKEVGRHTGRDSAYTADDGAAITFRWRSGWQDYGSDSMKRIRETKLWGLGSGGMYVYTDYRDSAVVQAFAFTGTSADDVFADGLDPADLFADGSDADDVFAGPQTVEVALLRGSHRGTLFSTEFRSTDPIAVHRADHHLTDRQRPPSMTKDA